jgi:cell division septum initiation protein DivIVA
VKVDRDELLDLLEHALERLPEEPRSARWLLKEREEFLTRTRREADEILAAARGQSERMVQRSEVMRAAEAEARRTVDESRAEAARIRNQCDDYCDRRLAQLEAVLERTMTVVAAGRRKLRPSVDRAGFPNETDRDGESVVSSLHEDDAEPAELDVQMFDQDRV